MSENGRQREKDDKSRNGIIRTEEPVCAGVHTFFPFQKKKCEKAEHCAGKRKFLLNLNIYIGENRCYTPPEFQRKEEFTNG